MREHIMGNKIWDEGQLRVVEGVLGTVDEWKKGSNTIETLPSHSMTIRWTNMSSGFSEGNSYLSVGFYISDIPLC